jgi:DUF4097 and DUF4098 domain-containing protein YvlB
MNRLNLPFLLFLICVTSACTSIPEQYTDLDVRTLDVADSGSILIRVDYGEVTVLESDDTYVMVAGQVLFTDRLEYQVSTVEKQYEIKVFAYRDNLSSPPLRVFVHVPKQMQVKVETDDASILVQDYHGDVEIASLSGNIAVERVTGELTLRSNRGSITVRESSGDIGIVGNYGALTAQSVHGDVSVSTIMGNILFDGLIQDGDDIRLEADHGSVSVILNADSALSLQVRSTSGDVACMLPGMTSSTRTCDGEFNANGGVLSIRTVSGAVTLQSTP